MFGKKDKEIKSLEQEPLRIGNNRRGTPQYQEWREKYDKAILARRESKQSIGRNRLNPELHQSVVQ